MCLGGESDFWRDLLWQGEGRVVWEERLEPTWNVACAAMTWLGGTPLLVFLMASLFTSGTLHVVRIIVIRIVMVDCLSVSLS